MRWGACGGAAAGTTSMADTRLSRRHERTALAALIGRLSGDVRGSVLPLIGAAIIPLICLIGSGIDLSRAYAAQSRLQVACDAASLAGRRAMNNGEVDATVRAEVTKFFNFNFPQGSFGAAPFDPVTDEGANSTVVVTANTTIPTSIMKIFGFATLPIDANCNAKQDFVNTDIVLVLDTTGSMDQRISGESTGPTKIQSLRSAVLALFDELAPVQTQLETAGLRLRYGIVPYSSNVNIGKVVQGVNASYIASDDWDYQSRRENQRGKIRTDRTENQCYGSDGGVNWIRTGSNRGTSIGDCYYPTSSGQTHVVSWYHEKRNYDISSFVTSTAANPVATPSRDPLSESTKTSYWKGCIEERQTVSTITSTSGYTIPANAYDLDIDRIPNSSKTTKWKPFWPEVAYSRGNSTSSSSGTSVFERGEAYVACPTEAKRLTPWTRDELNTYLNSLVAIGGTYHDIGMIWGARLLSRNGIFSADNPANYRSMPVSRFLIFLTDGQMAPNADTYTAYGIEQNDQRVTGAYSVPQQTDRHIQRFKMICNAAKTQNVSIWVIAFDSTLDSSMTECASTASQASLSSNQAQLIEKFVEIGKNIGSLRLTQ